MNRQDQGTERPRGHIGEIGSDVDTPYKAAVNAFELFLTGLLVHEASQEGRITEKHFANPLELRTNGKTLFYKTWEPDQIKVSTNNLMFAALATSAQAMDRALDDEFGAKAPHLIDPVSSARAIVYQMRNCFAHNPFNPRWEIKGKYLRVWRVDDFIELNSAAVNGKRLQPVHLGRLGLSGYVKLLDWCTDRMAERELQKK